MRLLAVDANSILNRAFYGVRPLTTKNGEHTNAVYGFMNMLLKILNDYKVDAVAFAFDLPGPTFATICPTTTRAPASPCPTSWSSSCPDSGAADRFGLPVDRAARLRGRRYFGHIVELLRGGRMGLPDCHRRPGRLSAYRRAHQGALCLYPGGSERDRAL